MLSWELFEFFGIAPRLQRKQLPRRYATVAHNVDLTHGTLKPFREPLKVSDKAGGVRLYSLGCDIYTWDSCVSVSEWLPDCPRLFISGRVGYPETAVRGDNGKLVYRRLGVPRPANPPVVSSEYKNTDTAREVAYVVTFVNSFNEEGAPSLPSVDLSIEDEQPVSIQLGYNPSIEYDIKSLRIYRRETGFRTGSEKAQEIATDWFLVAELPITTQLHTDTLPLIAVDFGLTTKDVREPPANIKNLTMVDESTLLVGSSHNKLLFSKKLQPHNFPLHDEMTLDDNIVALGVLGNHIFVATDGYPYKLIAYAGCDDKNCRDIAKYDQPHPMIACHTGKGSVVTPIGFVYVSADGLVLLPENGPPKVITTDVLSADDWRKLAPTTMRLAFHKGAIFIVSDVISMIYWIDNETYGDTKNKRLVTISDEPMDMVQTRQGELLMLTETGVYQWNASSKYRPYRWVSETIDSGFYFDITRVRARVNTSGVMITTESDRGEVSRNFPTGDNIIPYNRHGRRKEFQVRVDGVGEVLELAIGVSKTDMAVRS